MQQRDHYTCLLIPKQIYTLFCVFMTLYKTQDIGMQYAHFIRKSNRGLSNSD